MRHLYVHVPFCARRCVYCDFAIAVRPLVPADRFVRLVLAEHGRRRAGAGWDDAPLHTLYVGGGTPSLLPPAALARLVRSLLDAERADAASPGFEVTVEANPDDVSRAAAHAWRAAGVTRVSLGAQSFAPDVLAWMHRTHAPEAIKRAVDAIRSEGGLALSLDLIFARPVGVGSGILADVDAALRLEPEHLSVYGLTVEPGTALGKWVRAGAVTPAADDTYERQFLHVHERLAAAGYEHYEVSNYARPGWRARHNAAYWTRCAYGGLGPSAHGFHEECRWWNVRYWAAYERRVAAGRDPTDGMERLDGPAERLERVYLGLRTMEGVALDAFDIWPSGGALAARERGWLAWDERRVWATPEGWVRLDELVAVLTTSAGGG